MSFNWPYSNVALTGTINLQPNRYGLLEALGLFPSQSIANTVVEVRYEEGKIHVLPSAERGAPPSVSTKDTGEAVYLKVPHFPHLDTLTPRDIQDMVTVEGAQFRPRTKEEELAKRMARIRMKHDITREYLRMGALKGVIKDGRGKTLVDLYDKFGVTKKQVFFNLASGTTDVIAKCEEVFDHIATNLKGEVMTGVGVLVSSDFFNSFIQHAKVEKFYLNHQAAMNLTAHVRDPLSAYGRRFSFQNLTFIEYKGYSSVKNEETGAVTSEPFVASGLGHAFPEGTMDSFATYDASPDHMDMVNQPGVEIFITQKELDHGKGIEIMSQSNPLPVSRRPELLVEVSSAAS